MISRATQPALRSCVATSRWEMNPPHAVPVTDSWPRRHGVFRELLALAVGALCVQGSVERAPCSRKVLLPSHARGLSAGAQPDLLRAAGRLMAPRAPCAAKPMAQTRQERTARGSCWKGRDRYQLLLLVTWIWDMSVQGQTAWMGPNCSLGTVRVSPASRKHWRVCLVGELKFALVVLLLSVCLLKWEECSWVQTHVWAGPGSLVLDL